MTDRESSVVLLFFERKNSPLEPFTFVLFRLSLLYWTLHSDPLSSSFTTGLHIKHIRTGIQASVPSLSRQTVNRIPRTSSQSTLFVQPKVSKEPTSKEMGVL